MSDRYNGWLIYDKNGLSRNQWFAKELVKNLGCKLIIAEELEFGVENDIYFKYDSKYIEAPDFAVQRSIYPLLSQVLEAAGTRTFNSAKVCEICNDKRKTHLLALSLNIPTLKTAFSNKDFLNVPPMPFVIKGASGHGGSEVFMAENTEQLKNALNSIGERDLLFQEIAVDKGIDKRVYVLGGEVLAAVKRQAKSGFKSNFSLGGSAELADVSSKEAEIINKLCNSLKPDFVGIDFIYSNGEPYLNEVEDIVGTRMLYSLTDINAAKIYSEYILNSLKQ